MSWPKRATPNPVYSNLRLWIVSNPCWPCLALATYRYYDGSDSCLPSPRAAGLPAYLTTSSQRSASNHVMQPRHRFTRHIPAHRASFGLRQVSASSSSHTAESSSLYCGPPVRLRLLPTPPRGDAVTFDYRALAYPGTDFHHADIAPSRAHANRLEAGGFNLLIDIKRGSAVLLCVQSQRAT